MELIREWYDGNDHISKKDRKEKSEKKNIEKAVEELEQFSQRQSDEFIGQMLPGRVFRTFCELFSDFQI